MFKKCSVVGLMIAMIVALLLNVPVMAANYHTTTVTYPYYGFVEDSEHPWQSVFDALDETGTVEYSDEFFDEPSFGDHPELRAASYALALAGFENQKDGYPFDPSNPNPKLVDLLTQMGFSDLEFFDTASQEDGFSMGTTIGHKTLPSGQELIVIAPRNYNYMTEWLSNFNVGESGDHVGFAYSANLIMSRFNQYLLNHSFTNYKLWVVGYSRGGAVIDLFARNLNNNLDNYQLSSGDFYAYTFGAPRASATNTLYANIHDVKDGNDLLLGYVFPELWGFYNTGIYEEIHPADLTIPASVINISDLADGTRAMNLLSSNEGLTEQVGTENGRDFMDDWLQFVNNNGLTREYFDNEVKAPLSAIMKLYQMRTIDKQGEFTSFISDTSHGLAGMIAVNALYDFLMGGYASLDDFPTYQYLVKIMRGTASDEDIDALVAILSDYIDVYENYEPKLGEAPVISEDEFAVLKDNLPKLVKALAPLIVADAAYTQAVFGENYSLYYTYTLVSNAESLVIGHIPESIMPILKSLIVDDEPTGVPNSGFMTKEGTSVIQNNLLIAIPSIVSIAIVVILKNKKYLARFD